MRNTLIFIFIIFLACITKEIPPTSGYLLLERQYFSQQTPDSLVNTFTRKLYFNNDYSFLTMADSSATADDHLYIRDYKTNTIYLKKTFNDINYYASFSIEKERGIIYTGKTKNIQGYECKEGKYISEMNDTTTFWKTDKIGLDRTIWSLADPKGFVLEAHHQNGIKKIVKEINWESIDNSFFEAQIDTLKTYKKKSYYGLKIVEAEWELNHYMGRLDEYVKMKENEEISSEQLDAVKQQFSPWLKQIEDRIKALQKKEDNKT